MLRIGGGMMYKVRLLAALLILCFCAQCFGAARGALAAVDLAEAILDKAVTEKVKPEWRARTFEMAEALYQSIRMQLSVKRYKGIRISRGANLDSIDVPLNDAKKMKKRFRSIRKLKTESEQLRAVKKMVD
jgi:hypothetical protein